MTLAITIEEIDTNGRIHNILCSNEEMCVQDISQSPWLYGTAVKCVAETTKEVCDDLMRILNK